MLNTAELDRQVSIRVDASGEHCPMPLLKTKRALNQLASGQSVCVISTDSGSVRDIKAYAKQSGNELLAFFEENLNYIFYLKKA
ncbi:MAG: sulfurtransferase TusA family protein [Pseudomonadales bacterium]|nr:sulfurtransferase TusA family protein [Pseudomonadales bacterium]